MAKGVFILWASCYEMYGEIVFEMWGRKWWPFCLGLNLLTFPGLSTACFLVVTYVTSGKSTGLPAGHQLTCVHWFPPSWQAKEGASLALGWFESFNGYTIRKFQLVSILD